LAQQQRKLASSALPTSVLVAANVRFEPILWKNTCSRAQNIDG